MLAQRLSQLYHVETEVEWINAFVLYARLFPEYQMRVWMYRRLECMYSGCPKSLETVQLVQKVLLYMNAADPFTQIELRATERGRAVIRECKLTPV